MATRNRGPLVEPSPQEADTLQRAIRALGDYAHVSVRAARGHLTIVVDDGEPVARCTPLGAGQYGLSFHSHTGRWEKMPFVADLTHLANDLVTALGPYLQRWDFPDRKSGSDH
jgi:antitoxin (DNA-binding transcriptional repressor) of toxin-antitoxin stability system